LARLPKVRDHPYVRRSLPDNLLTRVLRLFDERPVFVEALDRAPLTFAQRDAWSRNLFVRQAPGGDVETIAIDWEMAGIDVLGRDLSDLVCLGVYWFDLEPAHLPAMDSVAFVAYLRGLRESGWEGDPRVARLGYAASAALRFGLQLSGVRRGAACCAQVASGTLSVGPLPWRRLSSAVRLCGRLRGGRTAP
jgi:hypothetical protein